MGRLFGTDGVRGIANDELTPALAFELGRTAAHVFIEEGRRGVVLVGRDTRRSGKMLEAAIVSGFTSMGLDVVLLGIVPTPAVAYLTKQYSAICGVVISASHNPGTYNGIKFFNRHGFKLRDEVEERIEASLKDCHKWENPTGAGVGRVYEARHLVQGYEDYLVKTIPLDLAGKKIALDCGHGALYEIAPEVMKRLGAEVVAINTEPDGMNINDNCGSTNPQMIIDLVKKEEAFIGLSFDGDGDRVIAVDELGRVIDGDHMLAIFASWLGGQGRLSGNTVVGTVMSNLGLKKYLASIRVDLLMAPVGDRYVLEEMINGGYVIGGEQSGHVIFMEYNTTGDGLATGLHLIEVALNTGEELSTLNDLMVSYPQVLINAKVPNGKKHHYEKDGLIVSAIEEIEKEFHGEGRVLIRPSGTEPLVRVMIEGKDQDVITDKAQALADLIEERMNG